MLQSSATLKSKEEAVALTATLQNTSESMETRCAACDQILTLTKSDAACSVLCSAGGIHAVINAMKSATDCEALLKGTVFTLRNLYRFDSKLTSIVVRLQDGISAMLEGLREHIHCADTELLLALLSILSEVAHNTANVQVLVKENGTAVILASVLAHLKNDQLLLPALSLLVAISRHPAHIATLVREGGVPAVLAAILAHLRRVEVLRAALIVLRNIVADDHSAIRLGGQGAYRIVFAVLQTHACVEQLELIRLGAAVLWRIHHARCPPTALLHSQLAFEVTLDHNGLAVGHSASGQASQHGGTQLQGAALTNGSSGQPHGAGSSTPAATGTRGLLSMARAAAAADDDEDEADDAASDCCGDDDEEVVAAAGEVGTYPRIVYDAFPPDGSSVHAGTQSGSLLLDAEFESANLRRAVQVGPREYNLVLNCDVNTRGHTQWFLFRVRGMEPDVPYRFHLINLMKPDSLFSSGMRPLVYSEQSAGESGIGWRRAGDEIAYFQNQYTYSTAPKKASKKTSGNSSSTAGGNAANAAAALRNDVPMSSYYTLTFRLTFPHPDDTAYVSQCYPYTYTMSQRLNTRLLQDKRSAVVRREVLCHSYGGNVCDVLTVTDFTSPPAEVAARKVVVISARVHPGESNASWMMQGFLEAVTADTNEAKLLRRTIMLKIVPMLNPDGVILGNYRCSVMGVDLNRNWSEPHEQSHPTIFHLKRMMRGYQATEQLLLFCDLHGHSRKRNIFAYGCETVRGPMRLRERIFPKLLSDCGHFSLGGCSFRVLRSKETTGRVVVNRQFAQANSFTLEASFCGADFGPGAGAHFTIKHLKEMGAAFVPALIEFTEPSQTRVNAILADLEAQFPAAEEDDENDGEDGGGGNAGKDAKEDATDKLRRAARRTAAGGAKSGANNAKGGMAAASAAAKANDAGAKSGGGKKKDSSAKESDSAAIKKKKKAGSGAAGTATTTTASSASAPGERAGNTSPRNTRSPLG